VRVSMFDSCSLDHIILEFKGQKNPIPIVLQKTKV
jgi:hypothetical protein